MSRTSLFDNVITHLIEEKIEHKGETYDGRLLVIPKPYPALTLKLTDDQHRNYVRLRHSYPDRMERLKRFLIDAKEIREDIVLVRLDDKLNGKEIVYSYDPEKREMKIYGPHNRICRDLKLTTVEIEKYKKLHEAKRLERREAHHSKQPNPDNPWFDFFHLDCLCFGGHAAFKRIVSFQSFEDDKEDYLSGKKLLITPGVLDCFSFNHYPYERPELRLHSVNERERPVLKLRGFNQKAWVEFIEKGLRMRLVPANLEKVKVLQQILIKHCGEKAYDLLIDMARYAKKLDPKEVKQKEPKQKLNPYLDLGSLGTFNPAHNPLLSQNRSSLPDHDAAVSAEPPLAALEGVHQSDEMNLRLSLSETPSPVKRAKGSSDKKSASQTQRESQPKSHSPIPFFPVPKDESQVLQVADANSLVFS